jgi:signal transduction histidine kinase
VLRNVRLTEQLLQTLRELQASRQRIVAAQDEERRRLERNIHDGAQQQLVALAVKVRLARSFTEKDPEKAASLLDQVGQEIGSALEDLRDLARGIYPPLLADQGLVAALKGQARKAPIPIVIEGDGIGRYPQETEAAVYFCTLEALQNVAKYARASRAEVRLADQGGHLTFRISDDGAGFDTTKASHGTGLQGMSDRLSALGGELEVVSAPGRGTQVMGRLPLGASVE